MTLSRGFADKCHLETKRKRLRRLDKFPTGINSGAGMTEIEQAILQTLIELDNAVKSMRVANPKPDLLPLFARLGELTSQLPPNSPRGLLHYLRKKSYEKGRLWLEDRKSEIA